MRNTAPALSPVTHTCSATPPHTGTLLERVDFTPLCTPLPLSCHQDSIAHDFAEACGTAGYFLFLTMFFLSAFCASKLPTPRPQLPGLTEPYFSVTSFMGPSFSVSICPPACGFQGSMHSSLVSLLGSSHLCLGFYYS